MLHIQSACGSEKRTFARRRKMWTAPNSKCPSASAEITEENARTNSKSVMLQAPALACDAPPTAGRGDPKRTTPAPDRSDAGVFVQVSGTLKRTAVKTSKICNDLRLLSSGPQAGFGELRLPPRQAGSSLMPGKVNPVIPEVVNQVAFSVIGNDVTITMAAEGGQLQLNAFEPIMCQCLLQSIDWLTRALDTLRTLCIDGIEVDEVRQASNVARSVGVATALIPLLGYARASQVAKEALASGTSVRDLVLASLAIDEELLDRVLQPDALAGELGRHT